MKIDEVEDQGVYQPNNGMPHNYKRVMVQWNFLNHYVSIMEPINSEVINIITLNGFKFNVDTGFKIDEWKNLLSMILYIIICIFINGVL